MMNLFPLSFIDATYDGYFLDKHYHLWSTKRYSTPVRIKNPKSRLGYPKYSRDFDSLILSLQTNDKWLKYISMLNDPEVIVKNPKTESLHMHVIALLNGDGVPKFSSKPKVHTDAASAKAETERLARENPGQRFAHFYCMGICSSKGITWE